MTLQDMIDAGICIEGFVSVQEWDEAANDYNVYFYGHTFSETAENNLRSALNMDVGYIYAVDDVTASGEPQGLLVIEVGRED